MAQRRSLTLAELKRDMRTVGIARRNKIRCALVSNGPMTVRDLKYDLHLSSGQVRGALQQLAEMGLVRRSRKADDGRQFVYSWRWW